MTSWPVHRRVFDKSVASACLILASPLFALAAVGIRFSSHGPIMYRATRVGRDGVPFTMYKLRTMRTGADLEGRISAASDARIFPFGALLRRTKVDELPQLINVLKGEMALVGTRPEDVTIFRDHFTPFMRGSVSMPPGLTSPGSLHYFADEFRLPASPAEAERMYLEQILPSKIAADLLYVRSPSFRYEIQILLRTGLSIIGLDFVFAGTRKREESAAARLLEHGMNGLQR